MGFKVVNFTKDHGKELCTWKYDDQYKVYNIPSWDIVCKCKWGITIEKKRKNEFFSLVDKEDKLCGYIRLVDKEDKVLVGVGLKPCLCGQGLGNEVMEILKSQCDKMYKGRKIVLEVRSFNKRAIKCYEKAGFKVIDICSKKTLLGADEFVIMEL